jgi:hypothetical protein
MREAGKTMKALEVGPFMLVWLAAVGCGSGSSTTPGGEAGASGEASGSGGFLGGSVGGVTFVAHESVASRATSANADVLEVLFSDATGLCAGSHQNEAGLLLLIEAAGASPQIAAGTYSVAAPDAAAPGGNGSSSSALVFQSDSRCNMPTQVAAQSGSITINSLTSAAATGTFDLTFPNKETLSGSFNAPLCPGLGDSGVPCLP